MTSIEHAGCLSQWDRKSAMRIARSITNRIPGLRCSFNLLRGSLFFHYGECHDYGPLELPFKIVGSCEVQRYSDTDIDDAVHLIRLGQLSTEEKDDIQAKKDTTKKSNEREARGRLHADREKDAIDYADFLDKKRRGTTKMVSA